MDMPTAMFRIARGISISGIGGSWRGCGCSHSRSSRCEAVVGLGVVQLRQLRHGSGGARGGGGRSHHQREHERHKHVHHHFSMIESATRSVPVSDFNFLCVVYTPIQKGVRVECGYATTLLLYTLHSVFRWVLDGC